MLEEFVNKLMQKLEDSCKHQTLIGITAAHEIDRRLELLVKIAKSINEWGFADFQLIQKTKNLTAKSSLTQGNLSERCDK